MSIQKVSAKELAEARDVLDRARTHDFSYKELSDAHDIILRKKLEDMKDDPILFCDSWIYSLMMQAIIIGSLVPLHIHLQKNNYYFYYVRFIMGMQVTFFLAEIGKFKERRQGRAMGSISHMLGIVAIILHLRLISPALAMGVGIPLSLWSFITFFYQCVALSCENILI